MTSSTKSEIFSAANRDNLSEELKTTFFNAVNHATDQLDKIRSAEGKNLKKDLETRLKNVETYVSQIESKSSKQRGEDFKRYKKRIAELLEDVSLDEQRLLQEVAIIAEKKDISEEIVRLGSYIQLYNTYFDAVEYALHPDVFQFVVWVGGGGGFKGGVKYGAVFHTVSLVFVFGPLLSI